MSSPTEPEDELREHAENPAESGEGDRDADRDVEREHAEEPAEG